MERSLNLVGGVAHEKRLAAGATHIRTFPLSLDASFSIVPSVAALLNPAADSPPSQYSRRHPAQMIAVQKPPSMFSSPVFRPTHARHPSAPVVVRPSHTPGVLNISKPVSQSAPRPQHAQAQLRAPRASPKSKPQQRSPQPAQAQVASVERTKASTVSPVKAEQVSSTNDKPPRGRKQHKQPKDAGRNRLASSCS